MSEMTDFLTTKQEAGKALQNAKVAEQALETVQAELDTLLQKHPEIAERLRAVAHNKTVMAESGKKYRAACAMLRGQALREHSKNPLGNRIFEDGLIEVGIEKNAITHWDEDEAYIVGFKVCKKNPAFHTMLFRPDKAGFKHLKASEMTAGLIPDKVLTLGEGYKASIRKGKERLLEFALPDDNPADSTWDWTLQKGLIQTSGGLHTVDDITVEAGFEVWSGRPTTSAEAFLLNCLVSEAWLAVFAQFPFNALENVTKYLVQIFIDAEMEATRDPCASLLYKALHMNPPRILVAHTVDRLDYVKPEYADEVKSIDTPL